jgi:hypothetical protein
VAKIFNFQQTHFSLLTVSLPFLIFYFVSVLHFLMVFICSSCLLLNLIRLTHSEIFYFNFFFFKCFIQFSFPHVLLYQIEKNKLLIWVIFFFVSLLHFSGVPQGKVSDPILFHPYHLCRSQPIRTSHFRQFVHKPSTKRPSASNFEICWRLRAR